MEGFNLKSEELRKVKHFLERAAAASGNGVRRWGKGARMSHSFVVDSGATKILVKKNRFMKKILNRMKIKIKDAVGQIYSSVGHGKLKIRPR